IYLLNASSMNEELNRVTEQIYQELLDKGFEVLYDDRNERPGVKFKDADLLGFPIRITVGEKNFKQGLVEITPRATKKLVLVKREALLTELETLKASLL